MKEILWREKIGDSVYELLYYAKYVIFELRKDFSVKTELDHDKKYVRNGKRTKNFDDGTLLYYIDSNNELKNNH